ncbi:MAG: cupin domain-containing protein [Pseudomonadota bacterium]
MFRIPICAGTALVALAACTTQSPEAPSGNPLNLPDPLAAGWRGAPVCEQLSLTEYQRVLRCTFPPGVGHERHYHPPHFGYALSGGRMRLTDAQGTRDVTLADHSYFSSDGTAWHEVENVGTTTVQYLIIEPLVPHR